MLTPNLPEAGVLLGERAPENLKEMRRAAERLRERMTHAGARWVVLKGGHLSHGDAIDLVTDGDRMIELALPRVDTKNTHGTGCTLSAAIAALLPQSPDVPTAIRRAKDYLARRARGRRSARRRTRPRAGPPLPRAVEDGSDGVGVCRTRGQIRHSFDRR